MLNYLDTPGWTHLQNCVQYTKHRCRQLVDEKGFNNGDTISRIWDVLNYCIHAYGICRVNKSAGVNCAVNLNIANQISQLNFPTFIERFNHILAESTRLQNPAPIIVLQGFTQTLPCSAILIEYIELSGYSLTLNYDKIISFLSKY